MKKLSLVIIFLLSFALHSISQTATGVVTQVPCNNDGIYTVTTTGIPLSDYLYLLCERNNGCSFERQFGDRSIDRFRHG